MSHPAIAPGTTPTPTIYEPQRVLVLSEDEQRIVHHAVHDLVVARIRAGITDAHIVQRFQDRLADGEQYANDTDELVRQTLRKRRLEEEVRRANRRIAELEETIVEKLAELGVSSMKHTATGATVRRDDKVWVRYVNPDLTDEEKVDTKARVAALMQSLGGPFEGFIKSDYNANTVSAYFRERYREAVEAQRALPEHERRPINVEVLMPECLRDLIYVDNAPHIQVRA